MRRLLFHTTSFFLSFTLPYVLTAQSPEQVWNEFHQLLKQGTLTEENIKPVHELLNGRWLPFLENRKNNATWEEWEEPEETFYSRYC